MKENDICLSQEEIERLCTLYMECDLSLLEETELHYVLGTLPYSSPIIEETRTLMDIAISVQLGKNEQIHEAKKKRKLWLRYLAAAASIAIVLTVGIARWINHDSHDEYYCQVYENGRKVSRKAALSIAESEMERIDNFIEKMVEIDQEIQAKMDSFNEDK